MAKDKTFKQKSKWTKVKNTTAVDWYTDKINKLCIDFAINVRLPKEGNIYEQAKAMEKEHIENAFNYGNHNKWGSESQINNGKDYYNETYGK
jgi:hypothetical protein